MKTEPPRSRGVKAAADARRQLVERLAAAGLLADPRVREAFLDVPRHLFVPAELAVQAYGDHALPIGLGQTITQPAVVAVSVELLEPKASSRVLEVGTGSGYQTAILARLSRLVFSLERISPLAERARTLLAELGVTNISVKVFDGSYGWSEQGPYDGIVVSAAAPAVPDPLLGQLKPGGRLVVPVGDPGRQRLLVVRKLPNGRTRTEDAGEVAFVPLLGRFGFPARRQRGNG